VCGNIHEDLLLILQHWPCALSHRRWHGDIKSKITCIRLITQMRSYKNRFNSLVATSSRFTRATLFAFAAHHRPPIEIFGRRIQLNYSWRHLRTLQWRSTHIWDSGSGYNRGKTTERKHYRWWTGAHFRLQINTMKCMPFWKGCNRHVDYLDRSHRGLSQVPYELHRYARCLEELLLDGNLITNLPQVPVYSSDKWQCFHLEQTKLILTVIVASFYCV